MKICYIATPGVHSNRWAKYFADKGHEVHMVTTSVPAGEKVPENIKLHMLKRYGPPIRLLNYPINSISLMFQLKKIIRNIRPEIIHAQSFDDLTFMGAVSGFHPFVVTAWGSDVLIAPKESQISKWIVKFVAKKADLITLGTEHIQEALIKLGADPRKFVMIHHGVDIRQFGPGQKNEKLGGKLGILNSPTVISIRHLNPLYNIETVINAMSLVLKEIPQAKLLLLGTGSQETMLKELSVSLGIAASVRFTGQVPTDEVPQFLRLADICVSTALSDGGPGGISEAMACELPVITTDFGDNKKWVEDGVNGFIIPLKSPQVLASKIIYLMRNPDIRRKFGKINRKIIIERNNWEKEMRKVEKLYEEQINRHKES